MARETHDTQLAGRFAGTDFQLDLDFACFRVEYHTVTERDYDGSRSTYVVIDGVYISGTNVPLAKTFVMDHDDYEPHTYETIFDIALFVAQDKAGV